MSFEEIVDGFTIYPYGKTNDPQGVANFDPIPVKFHNNWPSGKGGDVV